MIVDYDTMWSAEGAALHPSSLSGTPTPEHMKALAEVAYWLMSI